eukprot:876847_1
MTLKIILFVCYHIIKLWQLMTFSCYLKNPLISQSLSIFDFNYPCYFGHFPTSKMILPRCMRYTAKEIRGNERNGLVFSLFAVLWHVVNVVMEQDHFCILLK